MDSSLEWINEAVTNPLVQRNFLLSLLIILAVWLLRRVTIWVVRRRSENAYTHYQIQRISTYVAVTVVILFVGPIWLGGLGNAATYLGLLTAGVAIALQELILNFAGWLFIVLRRPFQVGDRIQIGQFAGDVIDQRIFQFTLAEIGNWVNADQSTGRVIHIPNGMIFKEPTANYSSVFDFIWNEIPVQLTFESNWKKSKAILQEIAEKNCQEIIENANQQVRKTDKEFYIFFSRLSPTVYTSVNADGILLTIRHITQPRQRRNLTQAIWEEVLDVFSEHPDIELTYPTRRSFSFLKETR